MDQSLNLEEHTTLPDEILRASSSLNSKSAFSAAFTLLEDNNLLTAIIAATNKMEAKTTTIITVPRKRPFCGLSFELGRSPAK